MALSRLHRLCTRSGVDDALIPDLCRLKTQWEMWVVAQRHLVNDLDLIALKQACADGLRVHVDGNLNFRGLRDEANSLASQYGPALTSTDQLTGELVFGLMMALAVEAER